MARGGYLRYKCRRCGGEEAALHTPNAFESLLYIIDGAIPPPDWGGFRVCVKMVQTHRCDASHTGLADCIGVDLDEEPGEEVSENAT